MLEEWSLSIYQLVKSKPEVIQDLYRYGGDFSKAWINRQEFRSVVRYRIKESKDEVLFDKFLGLCGDKKWAFVNNLYFSCNNVGCGLYVEHGFSTIVYANSIGKNFRINQNKM